MSAIKSPCLTVALLLIALSACSAQPSSVDSGLLSDKPCPVPCWNTLVPGKSTEVEVNQYVESLSRTEWSSRQLVERIAGCQLLRVADRPGPFVDRLIEFQIEEGTLTMVSSSSGSLPSLGEVAKHLGPPESLEATYSVGPDGEVYVLRVYYPGKGLALFISTVPEDAGEVRPEMKAYAVQYFEPGDLTSYIIALEACDLGRRDATAWAQKEIELYIRPWTGFGKVSPITTGSP